VKLFPLPTSQGGARPANSARVVDSRSDTGQVRSPSAGSGSTRPVTTSSAGSLAKTRITTSSQRSSTMQSSSVTATKVELARRIAAFCDAPSPSGAIRSWMSGIPVAACSRTTRSLRSSSL
jgi:hypothetical protein